MRGKDAAELPGAASSNFHVDVSCESVTLARGKIWSLKA